MQGLIIETSNNRSCIILTRDGCPNAIRHLDGGAALSKNLGKEVKDLIGDLRPDFVAIGTGPGSFTGIRVGAAMAQALAFGWQVPLIHFCSLEAFIPKEPGSFAIVVDARMGGIYCFKDKKPCLLTIAEVLQLDCVLLSPHPADIQKRIDRPVQEAAINADFLSAKCDQCAQTGSHSSLEPLPLTYFSSPAVLAGKT